MSAAALLALALVTGPLAEPAPLLSPWSTSPACGCPCWCCTPSPTVIIPWWWLLGPDYEWPPRPTVIFLPAPPRRP